MVCIIQFLIYNLVLIMTKSELWKFKPNIKIKLIVQKFKKNLIEVNHQPLFIIFKTIVLDNFAVYFCYSYDIIIISHLTI